MNNQDSFTGFEYSTLEDAEEALKLCPTGWWIDRWLELYDDWRNRNLLYNLDDIEERYP
jgi:hypothetical protein